MCENKPGIHSDIFLEILSQNELEEGKDWNRRKVSENEYIIQQGERSGKLYLVLNGLVRVVGYVELSKDSHVRPGVKDLGPGEVFGEISLFDRGVHNAGIMAVIKSEIVTIEGEALLDYCHTHPEFGCRFFREVCCSLAHRLRSADQQIFRLLGWGLKVRGFEPILKDL